jgi:hypothetical protein
VTATNKCACGRPTAGAHLCDRCSKTFSYALVNTAVYYLELDTIERKGTRFTDPAGGSAAIGKTQPLIVDDRFLDNYKVIEHEDGKTETVGRGSQLRSDVETVVRAWARRVAAPFPPIPGPVCADACLHVSCANIRRAHAHQLPESHEIPALVAYLARHMPWILRQPRCTDMLADFLHLERRLTRMVDRPPATWYAGKCSARLNTDDNGAPELCETELYARVDKGFIDCPGCRTRHDVTERREILLREAQNIHVTATEAAQALISWTDYDGSTEKLVDRIRKWRDRGKLEDVDMIPDLRNRDRHLYRLGDIQALLIETAQQRQAKRVGVTR